MRVIDPSTYDFSSITKEQLQIAKKDETVFDTKFETKPVGYFKDALIRFSKNKGSVVAAIILGILVLFAIFAPLTTHWGTKETNQTYSYVLPKVFDDANGFWDGTKYVEESAKQYYYDFYRGAIRGDAEEKKVDKSTSTYRYRVDTYVKGFFFQQMSQAKYNEIRAYEAKTGKKIFYPMIDNSYCEGDITKQKIYNTVCNDANYYYQINNKLEPIFLSGHSLVLTYAKDGGGNYIYYTELGNTYNTRVDYEEYYIYEHGYAPKFYFGSDNLGRDIYTRLAHGARLSLLLGVGVAFVNIILGVIYGAIEGYYGGKVDLVMERISDILVEIPSLVLLTLFQIYFASSVGPIVSLLFAFVVTGWIATAGRVRMQFYRFKRQEYVLAARTLGAKDRRIIFRHILPNAIGTLITSTILMIPSVVFTESTLSFLNIVDLESGAFTSLGTMLSAGQSVIVTSPHVILFPAIFISIMMIAFNLFGNGLRDAFNPSLRGVEE